MSSMPEKDPKIKSGAGQKSVDVIFPKNWGNNPEVLKAWKRIEREDSKNIGKG